MLSHCVSIVEVDVQLPERIRTKAGLCLVQHPVLGFISQRKGTCYLERTPASHGYYSITRVSQGGVEDKETVIYTHTTEKHSAWDRSSQAGTVPHTCKSNAWDAEAGASE